MCVFIYGTETSSQPNLIPSRSGRMLRDTRTRVPHCNVMYDVQYTVRSGIMCVCRRLSASGPGDPSDRRLGAINRSRSNVAIHRGLAPARRADRGSTRPLRRAGADFGPPPPSRREYDCDLCLMLCVIYDDATGRLRRRSGGKGREKRSRGTDGGGRI